MKKLLMLMPLLLLLGCTGNSPTGQSVTNTDDYYKIQLSEVTTNASFYSFSYGGKQIKFFAVLGSDGEVRTAFDACDVCGGSKGYRQSGSDMVCNNCGRHFKIDSLGTANKGGGCWPSYLPHTIQDGYILINKQDIISGGRFF